MKPSCEADGVTIYHGDALEVLDELGTPVDAVLTDPPYASGTRKEAGKPGSGAMLRGGRFADHPIDLDQMTTTGFIWLMRQTALRCYPLMPDGASFLSFIDWRMFATLQGALETCNYRAQTQIVWNKGSIGMGNGFRNQHELVIHASKGVPTVYDRGIGNVLTYPRVAPDDHPSPKPVGLLRDLLSVVSEPGHLILDPFMGIGSTALACREAGRRVIGIESVEAYCEVAAKRLDQGVLDFGGAA